MVKCGKCSRNVTEYRSECPCEPNIEVLCYKCTGWGDLYCDICNTLMCNECDLNGCKTCEQKEKVCLLCEEIVKKLYAGKCVDCSFEEKYLSKLLKK